MGKWHLPSLGTVIEVEMYPGDVILMVALETQPPSMVWRCVSSDHSLPRSIKNSAEGNGAR